METLERPLWLMDIDGVFLPFGSRPGWGAPPRKFHYIDVLGQINKHRYAPKLLMEVKQILHSGLVTPMWASSWCRDEPDLLKLEKILGLPYIPRAFSTCAVGGLVEKTRVARQIANSGRKLIWTDDNVVPQWGEFRELLDAKGALLIRPNPSYGLQPEDLQAIRNYIGIEVPA